MRKRFHRGLHRLLARTLAVTCILAFATPPARALRPQPAPTSAPIRTETYGYDALHRLTSVNYGDGQTQGYTFDAMGNRLTKIDNVAGNDTYSYNAANMLLSRNGGAYTNDANGNTLTGGGRTNTWDGRDRLVTCIHNGVTTAFTYGPGTRRRQMIQGSSTTDYIYDGGRVVRTLVNSVPDRLYLHGPRGPEYERIGAGSPAWYLYDGAGSVLGTVDSAGAITCSRKYDVFGALRAGGQPSGTRHKFGGSLGHLSDDETNLIYMRARYMDPATGRFISEDPAGDGLNWFAYAGGDPVNQSDPTGKFVSIGSIAVGSGISNGSQGSYNSSTTGAAVGLLSRVLEAVEVCLFISAAMCDGVLLNQREAKEIRRRYKDRWGVDLDRATQGKIHVEIGKQKTSSRDEHNPDLSLEEIDDIIEEFPPK
jgi:RHS repeat-associated protein